MNKIHYDNITPLEEFSIDELKTFSKGELMTLILLLQYIVKYQDYILKEKR